MLYERWCALVKDRGPELAARDAASGRRWTFNQLHAAAEKIDLGNETIVHPRVQFPEFLIDVLAGWRSGKMVCPLEPGQSPPVLKKFPPRCAHLKLTSATTGASRLVAFTEAQLSADVENIVATMGLRADWPSLGVISMPHSYGFSNLVLPLLLFGIPLIHVPSPLPAMLLAAAEGENAVTLAAVPAMWRAWLAADAIPKNTRLAISAAAPLPVKLEREIFDHCKLKIHNFYGSTECGGIAYDASNEPRLDDAIAGSPMRHIHLDLRGDGCLTVRSQAVGETYWPEPSPALGAGEFQTSDLAELKDNLVYLRGRISDQINVAGRKIAPESVERALRAHSGVKDCLVFGAPSGDAGRGETMVAVFTGECEGAELKEFLLSKLPAWQVPRAWWAVKSLEPNGRGKLSRAAWRERFLNERTGLSKD